MSASSACPCDRLTHPRILFNPPGRTVIAYRVGDYDSFRHALLLSRAEETELIHWRPGGSGDLAVQMIEWWAYLADILTFYNERIATQSYLRTADLPESVGRLIRLLGYRPRPGIGAHGFVAALLDGPTPILLPRGFAIQSKPGPGKQPQVFELDADTRVTAPDVIDADLSPDPRLLAEDGSVLLRGAVTSLRKGDTLLLLKRGWSGETGNHALVTVQQATQEKDPRGQTMTRVTFETAPALPGALAADYRLLRSASFAQVWQFIIESGESVFRTGSGQKQAKLLTGSGKEQAVRRELRAGFSTAHFVSLVRTLRVGDVVWFEMSGSTHLQKLVSVQNRAEVVWYKNDLNDPAKQPDPTKEVPIPVLHTQLDFLPTLSLLFDADRTVGHYDWREVGELIGAPIRTVTGTRLTLDAASRPALFPAGNGLPVFVEDANGQGAAMQGFVGANPASQITLTSQSDPPQLTAPLRVLFDMLSVSRGQSVAKEIMGSGDATIAGQEFVLKKSPLTYLPGDSRSGDGYRSTLIVRVNGVAWTEVPSFYGQPPDAAVFVTREDEQNKTHVLFGDGVYGARLPAGSNNVITDYRFGSGAATPDPGTLIVIMQPQPHLKAIRAPIPLVPGSDPDPPDQVRRYAPQSVLTFGRAVSADDYETIAAQTPGVDRARSYWAWDADAQRAMVTIYVGDTPGAVTAARDALRRAADPNRPVAVRQATALPVALSLAVHADPARDPAAVQGGVAAALCDAQTGLFGAQRVRIGQPIFNSEIEAACLRVPGALAVHALRFFVGGMEDTTEPHDPGEGRFFQLAPTDLNLGVEGAG